MMVWLVYPLTISVPNYSAFRKRNHPGETVTSVLWLLEIALVLVRFDHVARFIVNANDSIVSAAFPPSDLLPKSAAG
jgi:hypothetical protein